MQGRTCIRACVCACASPEPARVAREPGLQKDPDLAPAEPPARPALERSRLRGKAAGALPPADLGPPEGEREQDKRQGGRSWRCGAPGVEVGHLGSQGLSDLRILDLLHADALNVPEPGLTYVSEALLGREPEAIRKRHDGQQARARSPRHPEG